MNADDEYNADAEVERLTVRALVLEKERDAALARVAEREAELRKEHESHAATWKRAAENGRLLIESRAAVAEQARIIQALEDELSERMGTTRLAVRDLNSDPR